jgi:histidine triad (HIT) family protein
MNQCLFCKILKNDIPSHKIYEDNYVIAILDLFPNTEGQALVISKTHYLSDHTKMPEEAYRNFLTSAKALSHILKKKLEVEKVALVIEGTGVDHAHIKLYPLHDLEKDFSSAESKEKIYYDKYPGYIDTRLGEKADDEKLGRLANKIKGTRN